MFLDLSGSVGVNLCLQKATSLYLVSFPMKVERLYLQNAYRQHQRLSFQGCGYDDNWEYHVNRPQSVMRGVTRFVAQGIGNRERVWDARFLGGILLIRMNHLETPMWIGLWEGLEEDPNQLSFRFDPEEPTRFDFIG